MWNLDPPPGFRGLDPNKPVTFYYRHLPHWRQDGATYFVTFRLADSLPAAKLRVLRMQRSEWMRTHPPPRSQQDWEAFGKLTMQHVEDWLDQGMGSCLLKDGRSAHTTASSMHHFDGDRYELGCFAVMPNHVHAIVRPLRPATQPLEKILQSWKRHTSREIHSENGSHGSLWQEESFDRIVRDEEHLYRCVQYIGRNPRMVRLEHGQCPRWIRPTWEELGWRFDDS